MTEEEQFAPTENQERVLTLVLNLLFHSFNIYDLAPVLLGMSVGACVEAGYDLERVQEMVAKTWPGAVARSCAYDQLAQEKPS